MSSQNGVFVYSSLPIGRDKLASVSVSASVSDITIDDPSSLFSATACIMLPSSLNASPITAPYVAARFGADLTVCSLPHIVVLIRICVSQQIII